MPAVRRRINKLFGQTSDGWANLTQDSQQHGQHGKAEILDRFPAPTIDEAESRIVTRQKPRHRNDEVSYDDTV